MIDAVVAEVGVVIVMFVDAAVEATEGVDCLCRTYSPWSRCSSQVLCASAMDDALECNDEVVDGAFACKAFDVWHGEIQKI